MHDDRVEQVGRWLRNRGELSEELRMQLLSRLVSDADDDSGVRTLDPSRYRFERLVGNGRMGDVFEVYDQQEGRYIAWKQARTPDLEPQLGDEIRLLKRVQHPGVVDVYESGRMPHRGLGYFMPLLLDCRSFGDVLAHGNQLRNITILERVADAVAHAHKLPVIHRDIKPANVLITGDDHVYLMDWGTAASYAFSTAPASHRTALYTPSSGEGSRAGDVFALGVLLVGSILGAPHSVAERDERLAWLQTQDGELATLAADACSAVASQRPSAQEFVQTLRKWLTEVPQRDQAARLWEEIERHRDGERRLSAEAEEAEQAARALMSRVEPWDSASEGTPKWHAWLQEERAAENRLHAAREQGWASSKLAAAVELDRDRADLRSAQIADLIARHRRATRAGSAAESTMLMSMLEAALAGETHPYVRDTGTFTLETDPPGARVFASRYVERMRRMRAEDRRDVGLTPLRGVELPSGSWLLEIELPDRPTVRYPVLIERSGNWDGVAPEEQTPTPIPLPESLSDDEIYVPSGWAIVGGEGGRGLARRRVWVDGFVIGREVLTNRQWMDWLHQRLETESVEALWADVPSLFEIRHGVQGRCLYTYDETSGFHLPEGWHLDHPVVYVSWDSAASYARWLSEKTGKRWRLPMELEWEKAARGVDGRKYPWGNGFDHTFCHVGGAVDETSMNNPAPSLVTSPDFRDDMSPYGVHGMAGNVTESCIDEWREAGPLIERNRPVLFEGEALNRSWKGGHWYSEPRTMAVRGGVIHDGRTPMGGFRLVRSLTP